MHRNVCKTHMHVKSLEMCWTASASRLQSAERLAATLDSFMQVWCFSLLALQRQSGFTQPSMHCIARTSVETSYREATSVTSDASYETGGHREALTAF